MSDARSQRGQATVLTVVFITALLGMAALVLDVGSWFNAQRQTQAAADAAALAAAQALPESPGDASALATSYVAKNGAGSASITISSTKVANDTVKVHVSRSAPGFFAKLFGVDSVAVGANAVARSDGLGAARYAAPIAVDESHPLLQCKPSPCFNQSTTLEIEKVGPGAFRWINLDDSKGGTGSHDLSDWILRGFDGYMPIDWYSSDPGAKGASDLQQAMDRRIGDELLFPIYRATRSGGANFEYEVVGWVGFHLTSFSQKGNNGIIKGEFVRVIWEGLESQAGNPDYGARVIQLVE
jgi:Putative Flp pilus-assembly TadE/G-like